MTCAICNAYKKQQQVRKLNKIIQHQHTYSKTIPGAAWHSLPSCLPSGFTFSFARRLKYNNMNNHTSSSLSSLIAADATVQPVSPNMEHSCLHEYVPISVIPCSMPCHVKADGWPQIRFNGSVSLWWSSSASPPASWWTYDYSSEGLSIIHPRESQDGFWTSGYMAKLLEVPVKNDFRSVSHYINWRLVN